MGQGLTFAECDKKLINTLKRMEISSLCLKDSIEYLGSESLPIYVTSEWLKNYISSNSGRYLSGDNY